MMPGNDEQQSPEEREEVYEEKGAENACVAAATETVEEIFKVHAFFTMVAQETHRQSPTERQGKQRKDIGDIRK